MSDLAAKLARLREDFPERKYKYARGIERDVLVTMLDVIEAAEEWHYAPLNSTRAEHAGDKLRGALNRLARTLP
jgi:hypothetical protein